MDETKPVTLYPTYVIGPRVQFHRGPYTPYVKTLVGLSHFEFPYGTARGRYFVIAPGAGMDLMLGDNLKIRLIDVEYQQWLQFTFGTKGMQKPTNGYFIRWGI
ncbi:hypothetical protein [Edaphobacter bradus]|uniref:hypothetical protein n=1 Tax=Edaphobacter bradus TaxID=2259016 RepID=UPI0021DFD698|nr:hypothetical protein [Edaphobacter bradus]